MLEKIAVSIPYLQYLDAEGNILNKNLPSWVEENILLNFYMKMSLARAVDQKAVNLQRTGKLGTYPSSLGQEAVGIGTGCALRPEDVYCPYYRETGALLSRGVHIEEIFSIWGGDERGNNFDIPKEDLPLCIPISTQCLHAVGVGFAFQYRKEQRVAVTMLGEGGTSKGDFYEAMNLAATWNLPVVFIVNNNHWAISVPQEEQTATKTFAQKACAADIPCLRVDGNDIIAVYDGVNKAISQAREGKGPVLIEAITYRLCDHTTADDASRYQPNALLEQAWKKEPIKRLRNFLYTQSWLSEEKEASLTEKNSSIVKEATTRYLEKKPAPPSAMFDSLYAKLPRSYLDQYDTL